MTKYTFDSNALLNNPYYLQSVDGDILIGYTVLQEIDKIKMESNSIRGYQARRAVRVLKSLGDKIKYDLSLGSGFYGANNDDHILQFASNNDCVLVTGDYLMQLKSSAFGVKAIALDELQNQDSHYDYSGVKEVYLDMTNDEDKQKLADIYEGYSMLGMKQNEYLVIWDKSKPTFNDDGEPNGYELIDTKKFDGYSLVNLSYKNVNNGFMNKISPVNVKQRLLFDMLQDRNSTIKATFGGFGVGKDFVMISHAIDMITNHKNKVEKLIWVRNNVEVANSMPIGFLPSTMEDKLLPWAMNLADHLGGVDGLKMLMMQGKIEIQHLGFLRGRDFKNSILYCTECENNTKEHLQLMIGRIGEGSQLWVNGDLKQIDDDKFTFNNGVNALKKLGGQRLYGQVTLDKVERSETARLSDLLD